MKSRSAISALCSPSATSITTSSSLAVSLAGFRVVSARGPRGKLRPAPAGAARRPPPSLARPCAGAHPAPGGDPHRRRPRRERGLVGAAEGPQRAGAGSVARSSTAYGSASRAGPAPRPARRASSNDSELAEQPRRRRRPRRAGRELDLLAGADLIAAIQPGGLGTAPTAPDPRRSSRAGRPARRRARSSSGAHGARVAAPRRQGGRGPRPPSSAALAECRISKHQRNELRCTQPTASTLLRSSSLLARVPGGYGRQPSRSCADAILHPSVDVAVRRGRAPESARRRARGSSTRPPASSLQSLLPRRLQAPFEPRPALPPRRPAAASARPCCVQRLTVGLRIAGAALSRAQARVSPHSDGPSRSSAPASRQHRPARTRVPSSRSASGRQPLERFRGPPAGGRPSRRPDRRRSQRPSSCARSARCPPSQVLTRCLRELLDCRRTRSARRLGEPPERGALARACDRATAPAHRPRQPRPRGAAHGRTAPRPRGAAPTGRRPTCQPRARSSYTGLHASSPAASAWCASRASSGAPPGRAPRARRALSRWRATAGAAATIDASTARRASSWRKATLASAGPEHPGGEALVQGLDDVGGDALEQATARSGRSRSPPPRAVGVPAATGGRRGRGPRRGPSAGSARRRRPAPPSRRTACPRSRDTARRRRRRGLPRAPRPRRGERLEPHPPDHGWRTARRAPPAADGPPRPRRPGR